MNERKNTIIDIEFANPKIKIKDHLVDLRNAIEHANINLTARHKIKVFGPYTNNSFTYYIEVNHPDYIQSSSIPRHLKGISNYLSKKYKEYFIGNRLLNYSVVSSAYGNDYPDYNKFELLNMFIKILQSDDTATISKIKKIMEK